MKTVQVQVLTVSASDSVQEAAKAMKTSGDKEVYVLRNGKVVGIIHETDIVAKVVAEGLNPRKVKSEDIMQSPAPMVSRDAELDELLKVYAATQSSKLVIVDNGKPLGTIAVGEYFRALSCFSGGAVHRVCQAFASNPRLEIISLLTSHSMTIVELAEKLGLKEVTVRHHLRALIEAGVITEGEGTRGKPGRPSASYSVAPMLFRRY